MYTVDIFGENVGDSDRRMDTYEQIIYLPWPPWAGRHRSFLFL